MEYSHSTNSVTSLLNEFENLENLQPTEKWEQELLAKLASSRSGNADNYYRVKLTTLVIFLLVINLFVFLNLTNSGTIKEAQHYDALQRISKELLINEIASK